MQTVRDATISGFNEFVQQLQKDDPEATFALTLFDSEGIDRSEARKASAVALLDQSSYVPRSMTPLFDAVGRTVSQCQDNLDTQYMMVILTDGLENFSKEWNHQKLNELIDKKKASGRWTFLFLGANQDAWATGASMGMTAGQTMTYSPTAGGTRAAMSTASRARVNWSASATHDPNNPLAGVACADCGEQLQPNQTHLCPKISSHS
ncbi:MAG TPA: hypothetical protein VFK94_06350 [Patescibacteria group bacterium]|nr:hypothetical protein [Patescibacteria group bacterium]